MSQPINLILQGRYVGLYNIVDKVDKHRVWLPEETDGEVNVSQKTIDNITLPSGNYFLAFDWTEMTKKTLNPDRDISGMQDEFSLPNHSPAVDEEDTMNAWVIEEPDDKSFADYETDEDVALLRR